MTDLADLTARMRDFTEAREWGRFHNLKSLTLALAGEVGEVAELVQWLPAEEASRVKTGSDLHARREDELADVLLYLARLADVAEVDFHLEALTKLNANDSRFLGKLFEALRQNPLRWDQATFAA